MTRVLVTGASGNVGRHAVAALCRRGHAVRGLAHSRGGRRFLARRFGATIEIVRGDVRDRTAMERAVRGVDCVVHLAYLIPPPALARPTMAASVNLDGTRTVIDVARAAAPPPRLLFASSLDVYGATQHLAPPRRVGDPVQATDLYSGHKIACEEMVRASGLDAAILRFADVPPLAVRGPDPMMFRLPLDQRIEAIHPDDAGLAIARAVESDAVWGRTLNVGGGPRCQVTYREYLGAFLGAMGLGALPDAAFSTEPYCTDWLDSDESERLLGYQRHAFADIVADVAAVYGWRRPLARLAAPLVRRAILRLSPRWRARSS